MCSLSQATRATSLPCLCLSLRQIKDKQRRSISTASSSSVLTLLDNASIRLQMWALLLTIRPISILEVTPKWVAGLS